MTVLCLKMNYYLVVSALTLMPCIVATTVINLDLRISWCTLNNTHATPANYTLCVLLMS